MPACTGQQQTWYMALPSTLFALPALCLTATRARLQDARGDQCDSCGNLLNPTELIRPKCALTGTTPVVRRTRHMFLDLPQLQPKLQEYITRTSQAGGWSSNCVQVGPCCVLCEARRALTLHCDTSRGRLRADAASASRWAARQCGLLGVAHFPV